MSTEGKLERVTLTPEQLDALMPEGDQVHTFIQAPVSTATVLIGADWSRVEILERARKYGAELSGPDATAMDHGAVVLVPRPIGPVFIKTRKTPAPL